MSQDKWLIDKPDKGPSYARCKVQPGGDYSKLFGGTQRDPRLADEAGAQAIIDCHFFGRIRLYKDGKDYMRVEMDREWKSDAVQPRREHAAV